MFLSFLTRRHVYILTKDTFESTFSFLINRIEFRFVLGETYEIGSYRETTCCVLSTFFPIGITHRWSAVTAMQLPSTSWTILCVVGSFASLSRHLAYRAVVANMGLRPPLYVLKRHSLGTLWYDMLQRSIIAVSAAVAPVSTHWGSRFIASLGGGFVDNSWLPWSYDRLPRGHWPSEIMPSMRVGLNPPLQIELPP